jgi:hypothetical protein
MRPFASVMAAVLLVAACTDNESSDLEATAPEGANVPAARLAPGSRPLFDSASGKASSTTAASARGELRGRTGELLNPDSSAMVFLYYDLAGIAPPIEHWVEEDSRLRAAPAHNKAPLRIAIRAELESAAAAVRSIGLVRLSLRANLSEYDPTYGEFTLRALAPSSVVSFDAFGQKVSVKFANGRTAQIWRLPAAQAQEIRDKISYVGNVSLDALLSVTSVQPGPGGGTITTNVLEYELREDRSGVTLARVQLEQK